MGVGKRYWDVSVTKLPDDCKHKQIVMSYIEELKQNIDFGNGFIFIGDYGVGKTSLAVILAKATVSFGGSALFIAVPDLSDLKIKETMFSEGITLWDRALSVDLLVLDDIGSEHNKDWGLLERIIRNRVNDCKSIICTTNNNTAFQEKYGGGFHSIATSVMTEVIVEGKNWREKEKKEKDKSEVIDK